MASRIALLCLLGLLIASPAIADSGIYYQLAFMARTASRPALDAACRRPASRRPARDFYISGFTVYNATTDAPETHCTKTPFNPNEIIDIQGLKQYWSNITCPGNNGQSSWKNAWKKAGVCSGLEEKAYFEAALALRSRINPLVRLAAKGIKPDFGLYGVKAIKKVFQAGIRAAPVIQCSEGPFGKYQLYKMYFCAAENGTFIDCPAAPPYTCSKEILFHPFKKWMLKGLNKDGESFELPGVAMDY